MKILSNKIFLWATIVALLLSLFKLNSCNSDIAEQNRQINGNLTAAEKKLQESNYEIGVLKSELLTQKELEQKLKQDNQELDQKFKKFVKEYDLIIKSKDTTIAELNQKINGGKSETIIISESPDCQNIKNCVVSYTWADNLNRFKLQDPNIFNSDDEQFSSNQIFKINGQIWKQKNGVLEIRHLTLQEIYKDSNGAYVSISGAQAKIIDSEFVYSVDPQEKKIFNIRAIAFEGIELSLPTSIKFGLGAEILNFKNTGIIFGLSTDFKTLGGFEINTGIEYSPQIFGEDINLAAGLIGGTKINNLFREYSLSLGIIGYLTN